MKIRYVSILAASLALVCWVAFAADIDGKWTAEVQGFKGPQTQTLTLKADGATLTGTLDAGFGGAVNISDGKAEGMNVSFVVVREFQGNKVTQNYKGMQMGNELKLTVTVEGGGGKGKGKGPGEMTFKKQ